MQNSVTQHPRYADFAAVLAPPAPDNFGEVSDADLSRLSQEERLELLSLLEWREIALVDAREDNRPPIWHYLFDCICEAAERSADPGAYLDATLAHEKAKRRHRDRMRAERPIACQMSLDQILSRAAAEDAEAERLATSEGFPAPVAPRSHDGVASEADTQPARRPLPAAVAADVDATRAAAATTAGRNSSRVSAQESRPHAAPARDKFEGFRSKSGQSDPPLYSDGI